MTGTGAGGKRAGRFRRAASFGLVLALTPASFGALAAPLRLADVIEAPVEVSMTGSYYSDRENSFSLTVSGDRFLKSYRYGVSIIGLQGTGGPVYYLIDDRKRSVLKVSQGNLYRIGEFFNWATMTTLIDLPGDTPLIPLRGGTVGCTAYGVAGSDLELCVDSNRRQLQRIGKKGGIVAEVTEFGKPAGDLKEKTEAMMLSCRRRNYAFFDADADLSPDAD